MKPDPPELLAAVARALFRDIAPTLDEPARSQVAAASAIVRRVSMMLDHELSVLIADTLDMHTTIVGLEPLVDDRQIDLLAECRNAAVELDIATIGVTGIDAGEVRRLNHALQALVESAIVALAGRRARSPRNATAIDQLIRRSVARAGELNPARLRV